MGCIERQRAVRRARGYPPSRCAAPIINHPLSIINSPGFTLIELLVVIAVIAVLMAVLLPTLQRVRKQAKAPVCLSHLKQWGTTFALYTQENEGCLPLMLGEGVWLLRGAMMSQGDVNEPRVGRGVRTQGIASCPMATRLDEQPGEDSTSSTSAGYTTLIEFRNGGTLTAWEIASLGPSFRGSYGLNHGLFRPTPNGFQPGSYPPVASDNLSVKGGFSIPVLLDSPSPMMFTNWNMSPPRDGFRPSVGMPPCVKRHETCANGLFLDWSTRRIDLKELWVLRWYPGFDRNGRWTRAGGVQPEDWLKWMRGFKDY